MNKRAAVITFHRALNYGAILQAFALEKILAEIGVYAEIIDYRCPHIECIYRPFDVRHCKSLSSGVKKCIKSFGLIKKRHNFNEFTKKHLRVTKKCRTRKDLQRTALKFETIITHLTSNFIIVIIGTLLMTIIYSLKKVSSKS